MKRRTLFAAAVLSAVAASPTFAHHSFAMFDQTKIISLRGTVHEFQWTNPHSWIEMDVTGADGRPRRWSLELNSPNNLARYGWRRNALRPGETVTIRINPLRDGKSGGLFLDLVRADGTKLDSGLPKDGRPINTPSL